MLFNSLHELVKTTKIICFISSDGEQMKVTVLPKAANESAPPALSTPLQLVGTPDELDSQFPEILKEYTETRTSLVNSLAASQAVMEAAKKEATDKAAKVVSAKTSQAARTAPEKPDAVVNGESIAKDDTNQAQGADSDLELF